MPDALLRISAHSTHDPRNRPIRPPRPPPEMPSRHRSRRRPRPTRRRYARNDGRGERRGPGCPAGWRGHPVGGDRCFPRSGVRFPAQGQR